MDANDDDALQLWECLISLTVSFKLVSSQSEVWRQTKNDKSRGLKSQQIHEGGNLYKFTGERTTQVFIEPRTDLSGMCDPPRKNWQNLCGVAGQSSIH